LVERVFTSPSGTYVPETHFKWLHELANPAFANTAAFTVPGATAFTTNAPRTAADTFNPGIGLTFLSCSCTGKTWSLEAVYDFFWRSDSYSAHQVMVRLTAHF
jgi:hypothetical protein